MLDLDKEVDSNSFEPVRYLPKDYSSLICPFQSLKGFDCEKLLLFIRQRIIPAKNPNRGGGWNSKRQFKVATF